MFMITDCLCHEAICLELHICEWNFFQFNNFNLYSVTLQYIPKEV
jgi:hypothetical protein